MALNSPVLDGKTSEKLLGKCIQKQTVNNETGEVRPGRSFGTITNEYGSSINYSMARAPGGDDLNIPGFNIRIEASVHKLLVGHNILGGPSDFLACAHYLIGEFERLMDVKLPPPLDWTVARVDIAQIFELDPEAIELWIHLMKQAQYPRRKLLDVPSISIPGVTTMLKGYHKGQELLEHDRKRIIKNLGLETFSTLLDKANRILRIEVEIKRDKLASDLEKDRKVGDVTDDFLLDLFDSELDRWYKSCAPRLERAITVEKVFRRLDKKCTPTQAAILMRFWNHLSFYGEEYLRTTMPKSTFNKKLRQLRDLGIGWQITELSPLDAFNIIPGDFTPHRGNKYHRNDVLPEVIDKLSRYKRR